MYCWKNADHDSFCLNFKRVSLFSHQLNQCKHIDNFNRSLFLNIERKMHFSIKWNKKRKKKESHRLIEFYKIVFDCNFPPLFLSSLSLFEWSPPYLDSDMCVYVCVCGVCSKYTRSDRVYRANERTKTNITN